MSDGQAILAGEVLSGGFVSSLRRVWRRPPWPYGDADSIVAKLPVSADEVRAIAQALQFWEREIGFYETLAAAAPLRLPQFYGLIEVPEVGRGLALEDLRGWTAGDQTAGVDSVTAQRVLQQVAKLHAQRWASLDLTLLKWLPGLNDAPFHYLLREATTSWKSFARAFGDDLPVSATTLTPRLLKRGQEMLAHWSATRPLTAIHGDLRAANILTSPDGQAIAFIDFQLAARAPGAVDVAHFLCGSMTSPALGQSLDALVGSYHHVLVEHGVAGYPLDACWHDFRIGLLLAVVMNIVFGSLPADGDVRAARREVVRRYFSAADSVDAFEILRR